VQDWIWSADFKSEFNRDTCSRPLALPSLSRWISLALLQLKHILKHTSVFRNLLDSLYATYSCWHLTLSVNRINCVSTFELNSYKVIIIFVIIKPLYPKLAHAFGYRLILSASMDSHTWPVIVSVTKRACSSLPVPRNTADENSNHIHFIIEDSFTVQLTFNDGNCSSSIYLLAFHLCFVSKTQVLFTNYMHTYLLIILIFMTFGHSKLIRQQTCNY